LYLNVFKALGNTQKPLIGSDTMDFLLVGSPLMLTMTALVAYYGRPETKRASDKFWHAHLSHTNFDRYSMVMSLYYLSKFSVFDIQSPRTLFFDFITIISVVYDFWHTPFCNCMLIIDILCCCCCCCC